jgi:CysZ protein
MLLAFTRALISLLNPRMLWLMVWPVLVALGVWLLLALVFWSQAAQWIDVQIGSSSFAQWMIAWWPFAVAVHWVILVLAFIPLVLVTATLLIGIFAMPAMVNHVADTWYPWLARRRGGSFAGSLWNSMVALAVFLALAIVTLPVWLIPLLWPVIPILLFAYLNQRVFRYDALAEHATPEEMSLIFGRWRAELFLSGVVIAIIGHVPIVGFFVPVYGALVSVHYCLDRLQKLRAEPIEGQAVKL